jgi:catechol 2,3-dioxygenase-like lactoylglutathione lyase family enzyme
MTMKRTDNSWLPADDYGRQMPTFSVNLLVRDVQASLPFYRDVLGAKVHYADEDFAALNLAGAEFMLHSDHTYDHHPLHQRIANTPAGQRGSGAELRVMGIDPDAAESRAKSANATIIQPAADYPHGWRDVILADRDGYTWAVGLPLKK